ncbi:MAG: hypothetical protein QF554_11300 [Dehalococcoidia bacterium]|jgi:hypothetical protein|nr:hypothetical protein [Dehalococcoidia bacterium]
MATTITAPIGVINTYAGPDTLKTRAGITGSTQESLLWLALFGASRVVDRYCNRHFFVVSATRQFDVEHPGAVAVPDLAAVTAIREDANRDRVFELTLSADQYLLYPTNASPERPWGRPYTRLVADPDGTRPAFTIGRRAIEIDGDWGFRRVLQDTGADLNEGSPLSSTATSVTVTDGSLVDPGATLWIEQEQVFVRLVTGNDLTVERGVNGTTAVTHADASDLSAMSYPAAVSEATLLIAGRLFSRKDSPMAVTAGSYGLGAPDTRAAIDPDAGRLLSTLRRLPVGLAS